MRNSFNPPLQPLLLWQSLSFFWFCGLLAAKFPLIGLICLLVFVLIDSRLWRLPALSAACVLFLFGICAIYLTTPQVPPTPSWTMSGKRPVKLLLQGQIVHVQSLPESRLRIFLKDVHAVHAPNSQKLTGLTVWTWSWKEKPIKGQEQDSEVRAFLRPLPGQSVRINASIQSTESFRNRWMNDFGEYWQNQSVFWRIWTRTDQGNPQFFGEAFFWSLLRENIRQHLYSALNFVEANTVNKAQALAFIPALLMYERFGLTNQTLEKMQAVSLIHSLALSGQHLWLVILYSSVFIFIIGRCNSRVFLYLAKNKILNLCCIPLAIVYLWIGNAPPSLVRAAIMLMFGSLFYWRMSTMTIGQILLVTTLCITVFSPNAFYNIGLQLSVLCVACICLIGPVLVKIENSAKKIINPHIGRRIFRYFAKKTLQIFLISLSIQLALLPIFLSYFPPSGMWFFSNVIWLPVLGLWVLPLSSLGLICAIISWSQVASFLFELAAWPCIILLETLSWMNDVGLLDFSALLRPSWTSMLACTSLALALCMLMGRVINNRNNNNHINGSRVKNIATIRRLTFITFCLFIVGPLQRYMTNFSDILHLELMDVGQGQAIYIKLPGSERLLIDGGGGRSKSFSVGTSVVLPSIIYNDPPRLWAMINTHPDLDHLRGLVYILEKVNVKNYYDNGENLPAEEKILWQSFAKKRMMPTRQKLFAGMKLKLPTSERFKLYLEVLSPEQNTTFADNNASLILRLVQEQDDKIVGIALLSADAELEALQALIDSKQDISAKILILPHHGAKDGLLKEFYQKVNPQIALVSAGRYNFFGHPHMTVQKALNELNIPLYNTAENGAISVFWHCDNQTFDLEDVQRRSLKYK